MSYYRYNSKRSCVICGTEFTYSRSDKVFCSDPNCRKKASREKQGLDKTAKRALEAIRSLEAYIQTDHRLNKEALKALENLSLITASIVTENKGQRHIFTGPQPTVTSPQGTD